MLIFPWKKKAPKARAMVGAIRLAAEMVEADLVGGLRAAIAAD